MAFKEILRKVVESVDGANGAIVIGYDGIPIDQYLAEDVTLDLHLLAVEYSSILRDIKKTLEVLGSGDMEEVSINTGTTRVIMRPVTEEFFVALALDAEGNYGKGRYVLKRDAGKLREELA
ncbi:MAG: roadblock/LC7 domain-containing protein [Geobacter sp.]|nr:roadblock/LC7 domain-containing protein [Geobacter sp.]